MFTFTVALFISIVLYLLSLYLINRNSKAKEALVELIENLESPGLFYFFSFLIVFLLVLLVVLFPSVMIPVYISMYIGAKLISKIHKKE